MVFGVFDRFHKGHEFFLSHATEQCEQLVVVVTLSEVSELFKKKSPSHAFEERVLAIKKYNDKFLVVPGDTTVGEWAVLKKYSPNMVFLGYDQQAIAGELDRLGVPYSFIEAYKPETYKTSLIG